MAKVGQYLLGVITTVAVSVGGYLLKESYEERKAEGALVIEAAQNEGAVALRPGDLATIQKAVATSNQVVYLSAITTRAVGTQDIENGKVSIEAPTLLAYGTIQAPASNPNNVHIKRAGDALEVTYAFFGDGQQHRMWIARGVRGSVNFEPNSKGLRIVAPKPREKQSEEPFFLAWVPIAGALLGFMSIIWNFTVGRRSERLATIAAMTAVESRVAEMPPPGDFREWEPEPEPVPAKATQARYGKPQASGDVVGRDITTRHNITGGFRRIRLRDDDDDQK